MSRSYVKVENLAEEVFRRNASGETNREIGEHFGLTKEQAVAEYVQFYNNERINLKDGLTPYEIRSKAA